MCEKLQLRYQKGGGDFFLTSLDSSKCSSDEEGCFWLLFFFLWSCVCVMKGSQSISECLLLKKRDVSFVASLSFFQNVVLLLLTYKTVYFTPVL